MNIYSNKFERFIKIFAFIFIWLGICSIINISSHSNFYGYNFIQHITTSLIISFTYWLISLDNSIKN